MPDKTKTMRLHELTRRFQAGARYTVDRMEREFGITRRTANRDLNDLAAMGVHLLYEELPDGQRSWYVGREDRKVDVTYSIRDVMSLFLGRRMFDFLTDTSLEDSFHRVYSGIEEQLRKKDQDEAKKLVRKIYLVHEGPKKLPKRAVGILDDCLTGLLREEKVRIGYVNHQGYQSHVTICPYTLVAYKRGIYLLGAVDEYGGKLRTYSLERMTSAAWQRGVGFEYPKNYDPEKFFADALFIAPEKPVRVELVFTKGTAPFIKFRKFHRSQKLQALKDGRVRMTLRVPILFETVNWLLSFGSNVKVIGPPELRDTVRAELQKALAQYGR